MQGGLFATFCEKIGDPLKKESFTTSRTIFHKRRRKDPSKRLASTFQSGRSPRSFGFRKASEACSPKRKNRFNSLCALGSTRSFLYFGLHMFTRCMPSTSQLPWFLCVAHVCVCERVFCVCVRTCAFVCVAPRAEYKDPSTFFQPGFKEMQTFRRPVVYCLPSIALGIGRSELKTSFAARMGSVVVCERFGWIRRVRVASLMDS